MKKEIKTMHYCFFHDELVFKIGHKNFMSARQPLKPHHHENLMEFTYIVAGNQTYQLNDIKYQVNKGEVFFTFPNEVHSTGGYPEEVTEFYYLLVDPGILEKADIFVLPEEYESFREFWLNLGNRIYKPSPILHSTLKQLMSHFKTVDVQYNSRIRNSLSEVMIALTTLQSNASDSPMDNIAKSLEYIRSHITEPIRVSELCSMVHLSVSAYNEAFVKAIGIPPGKYILRCKIEKAKEILTSTQLSITDIAFRLGFSSSQYFATVFKRLCYKTPAEYRKSHSNITTLDKNPDYDL